MGLLAKVFLLAIGATSADLLTSPLIISARRQPSAGTHDDHISGRPSCSLRTRLMGSVTCREIEALADSTPADKRPSLLTLLRSLTELVAD